MKSGITSLVTKITVVNEISGSTWSKNFDLVMWISISTSERCLECWTVIDVIYVFTRAKISHVKIQTHEYIRMFLKMFNKQANAKKLFLFLSFFVFSLFQLVLVGARKDV